MSENRWIHLSQQEVSCVLDRVYDLSALGKKETAIDLIFDYGDAICQTRQFSKVDEMMEIVDLDRLPSSLSIGILVVASWVKWWNVERREVQETLKNREKFYERVKTHIIKNGGYTEERASFCLRGLE